jgi:CBS domain-containing protein
VEGHSQLESAHLDTNDGLSELQVGEGGRVTVRDLMRTRPKTLPSDVKVGDLRRLFANPHVLDVLLVDGEAFVGVVDRDDVDEVADDVPAQALAHSAGVTIGPDATWNEAMARLEEDGAWRLVVVDSDGFTLQGLLCLNAKRTGFCR